jgi:hypothetical protein
MTRFELRLCMMMPTMNGFKANMFLAKLSEAIEYSKGNINAPLSCDESVSRSTFSH